MKMKYYFVGLLAIVSFLASVNFRITNAGDHQKYRPVERRNEVRRAEERHRQEERFRSERERQDRSRYERERQEHLEQSRQERERQESAERLRTDREVVDRNLIEGQLPLGFQHAGEFNTFVRKLNSELIKAGCPEVEVFFQGSSVTGRKYEKATGGHTGPAFDVGRVSDFDIALCSKTLFERARLLDLEVRSDSRTEPLSSHFIQRKLGLDQASRNLEGLAGREVNFMIYESRQAALQRAPSIPVHRIRN